MVKLSSQEIKLSQEIYDFLSGELLIQQRDLTSALDHYERLAYSSQDESLYSFALALAMQLEDYQRAIIIAHKWLDIESDNLNLRQALVSIHLKFDQYQEALPHIEFIVENDDDIYMQVHLQAQVINANEKNQQTEELMGLYPNNRHITLLYALSKLKAGDYATALQKIEAALALKPEWIKAQMVKADVLFALGRVEEGLALLKMKANAYPTHKQVLLKTAKQLFLYDKDIKSYFLYKELHQLDANNTEVIYALGILHLRMQNFDESLQLFKQLAEYADQNNNVSLHQRALYYLGRVYEDKEQYNDALLHYGVINDQTLINEAIVSIARIFRKQGRFDLVTSEFEKARSQLKDDRAKIAMFIAQAEMLHQFVPKKQVLAIYEDALNKYRNELNILYSRAMFASDIRDIDLAEQDLKQIIKADSRNWQALNALGYLLADNNVRLHEAKVYIQKAYKMHPYSAAVVDSVGWIEFRLNNIEKAEEYVKHALQMHGHPEILGHLVEILLTQNKEKYALDLLEQALEKFPDDTYLQELYDSNYKKTTRQ